MAGLQGKVFDGYQLTEQLNGGSIAEVYRARPVNPGGREAVVKVIHPEFAQQRGFLPHFREIVKLSKRLASHPHTLPLLASGEDKGYLYLITPYVSAGTLKDWIARGERLGAADAGPFFHQLCDALGYAHSLGIVHSNIKPSNIFLFEGRHILLGDFGMLLDIGMLREFAQMDAKHSAEAVEYLAPEVATSTATQLSDIYSVGAVLFAAITGQAPFRGATLGEVLMSHERKPVPHLQQVSASLTPAMQALDVVTQRALAKRPEDRFSAAAGLTQAIDATLRQVPAVPQGAVGAAQMPPMGQLGQMAGWPQGAAAGALPGVFGMPQAPQAPQAASGAMGLLGFAAGAATARVGPNGQILQALNPPFPPLPASATVDETMEHGRVNFTTEASTPHVPAPQALQAGNNKTGLELQQTSRIPSPRVAVGMERGNARNDANRGAQSVGGAGSGSATVNPTSIPPSSIPPSSFPGYQQGYDWTGNSGNLDGSRGLDGPSGDLHPQQIPAIRGMGAAPTSAPGFATSGNEVWASDNDDNDAAGWEKLNSQRYASVNPNSGYNGAGNFGSYGAEEPWPEYTGEGAVYSPTDNGTGHYQASGDWNEEYTGEYSREYSQYTGTGYAASEDSREMETWTAEQPYQSEHSDGRAFSPTQLGLPRLTSPALGTDLPPAWQDIIGGTLPPDSREYSAWNGAAVASGFPVDQPSAAIDAMWPDSFAGTSNNGNGRGKSPAIPAIPLTEQHVWTVGSTAVKRRGGWIRWLVPLILIMVVVDLGIITIGRPDLCPGNSCQGISTKAHQFLPFLKGANAQATSSSLNAAPAVITMTVATNKTATTTLKLTNAGPDTANWKALSGFSWLTLDSTNGVLKANNTITLTLTAAPAAGAPAAGVHTGSYTAAITITNGSQVLTIPVTITVTN